MVLIHHTRNSAKDAAVIGADDLKASLSVRDYYTDQFLAEFLSRNDQRSIRRVENDEIRRDPPGSLL